jgi:hypothetical protein
LLDRPRILASSPTRWVRRMLRQFFERSDHLEPLPTTHTGSTEQVK